LGKSSGSSITSGSNLTTIGYNAEPSSATATNEITLGDANVTDLRVPGANFYIDGGNVGIGTSSPESTLHVQGNSDLQSGIKVRGVTSNGNTLISDRYVQNESLMNIGLAHSGGALVLGSLVKPSDSSESDATGYLSSQDAFSSKRSVIKIDGDEGAIKFLTTNTSATVAVDTAVAMTERVRIHSNGVTAFNDGIALGVGVNNTSSNVLDDYEEGTWTPVVNSATGFSTGVTNNYSMSKYTKIGNTVWVKCRLQLGNSSGNVTAGDNVTISGLPFTPASSDHAINCHYRYNENNALLTVTTAESANLFCQINYVRGTALRNGGILSINYNYRV